MRIILSPAKTMKRAEEVLPFTSYPVYIDKAEILMNRLKSMNYEELKKLWGCSEKLALENYERLQTMDLRKDPSPALTTYDGLAFKYMAPVVFDNSQFEYVGEHLRILSGFYGSVKPFDGVVPYRLEMKADLDLYEFWGRSIYEEVVDDSRTILNLASKEYSKCIEKYLEPEDRFITCIFAEMVNGKLVQKGTYAKMARGEMVRFMAENDIQDVEDIRKFDRLGFRYLEEKSNYEKIVFLKE